MRTFSVKPCLAIFLFSLLFSFTATAQLSGSYTIDAASSASSTNYRTFRAAIFDLTDTTTALRPDGGPRNGEGVSGAVIFKVAAGSYPEQVSLGAVQGASSTNTVTFDGGTGNAGSRIISYSANSSTDPHTFRIKSASNIHLRNLTIRTYGYSYSWAVHFMGNSGDCSIRNCVIDNYNISGWNSSFSVAGIVVNNSSTSIYTKGTPGNLYIDSNIFRNGNYGFFCYGAKARSMITINANTFAEQNSSAVYVDRINILKFTGNRINISLQSTNASVAIDMYNSVPDTDFHDISSNSIINVVTGINVRYTGSASDTSARCRLSNNMIGGGFRTNASSGIHLDNSSYWDIHHNSVNLDIATASPINSACYIESGKGNDIRNNIFAYTVITGWGLPLYINSSTAVTGLDYNNYYREGAEIWDQIISNGAYNLASMDFKGANGQNNNSESRPPYFKAAKDLHIQNPCYNGTPLNISTDIDGNSRSSTAPDIGADEFNGSVNDAGISQIITPSFPLSSGTTDIRLIIKNYGSSPLTSANVHYSINGSSAQSTSWTGSLATCDTASVLFTGSQQYNFTGGTYNVVTYTSLPNGVSDTMKVNDTLKTSICFAMSGNYTIDPAGTGSRNFVSFSKAATSLSCGGVSGPVYFTVAAATYTEQVEFKNIKGLSAANTVTFDGGNGNASNRIITYAANVNTSPHTIRIRSCQYIHLRNLSIKNSGATFGVALQIRGTSNNCSVKRCILEILPPGSYGYSKLYMPLLINNSDDINNIFSPIRVGNLEIDSNTFYSGYYGIMAYGFLPDCGNIAVRNNVFSNQLYTAALFSSVNGVNFSNNQVSTRNTTSSFGGVSITGCNCSGTNRNVVNGNKITYPSRFGIHVSNSQNPDTLYRCSMINNLVGGGFNVPFPSGILVDSSSSWDIMHNNVNLDTLLAIGPGSAMTINNSSRMRVKNNQLAITTASFEGTNFSSSNSSFKELDYNNYYRKIAGAHLRLGTKYYYAQTYKGVQGWNVHSVNSDPLFISKLDLHIKNACNAGDTAAAVTKDYDGDSRVFTSPDMGADEITGKPNDAGIAEILTPLFPAAAGLQDIKVVLKNYGTTTLTSANVSYLVNGANLQTIAWTGSLTSCDTAVITFTGNKQFNFTGKSFQLKVFSSSPNGQADSLLLNDTLQVNVCPSLNGTYTIDPAGTAATNFKTFKEATDVLSCGGISGPVLFNVAAATYTEQVTVGYVTGVSATNTITFKGVDSLTTIITFNGNYPLPHTLRLNQAKHVHIKNLTVASTGFNSAVGIHLTHASDSNTISGCLVKMNTFVTTSQVIGIAIMGQDQSVTGNYGNWNTIKNCNVDGGGTGILMTGHPAIFGSNNTIRESSITNTADDAIQLSYQDEAGIYANYIQGRAASSSYGVYAYECKVLNIERNYLKGGSGGVGIDLSSYSFMPAKRSRVVNNIITNFDFPVRAFARLTDFFHNTTYHTYNYGNSFYLWGGNGNSIKNNIFYGTNANGSSLIVDTLSSLASCDYNNYFKNGSGSVAKIAGTTIYYLADFKTAYPQFNQGSISQMPDFVSISTHDLHLKNSTISPTGASVNVTVDIDNDARCSIAPTMGADEPKYTMQMPIADFDLPDTAWLGSRVNLQSKLSSLYFEKHEWDVFNNGSIDFVKKDTSYLFTTMGTYSIKLIRSNCLGKDSMVKTLVVDTPHAPPVVYFSVDKKVIDVWQAVNLFDSSTNNPTSWAWTITPTLNVLYSPSKTVNNPLVTFGEPGLYAVCLSATNNIGTTKLCKPAYIEVQYVANMCISPFDSRESSGKLFDSGGPTSNYTNSENCSFLIEPCADTVKLAFSAFSLMTGDYLRVYDGTGVTGTPLHSGIGFTGSTIPATLVAKSGKMFIVMATNSSTVSSGFAASWTSVKGNYAAPVASYISNTTTPYVAYEKTQFKLSGTTTGNVTWSWDTDNDGVEDYNTKSIDLIFPNPGVYPVKLTVKNCGGTHEVVHQINIVTPTVPPFTDFIADLRIVTTIDTVSFTDLSDIGPTSWKWSFTPSTVVYRNGTDSSSRNPRLTFAALGTYTVKLSATNAAGTHDTVKTAYIKVIAYCIPSAASLSTDIAISRVELKGLNNPSTTGQAAYTDYTRNGKSALLLLGESASLKVSRSTNFANMTRKAWIDFNIDGVFDASEKVLEEPASKTYFYSAMVKVPRNATKGYTRMRVATSAGNDSNLACGPHNMGEFEDYRIIIIGDTVKPVISLTGKDTVSSEVWYKFTDPGFSAVDNVDGNMTALVKVVSNVDTTKTGYYTITYNVTDSAGNAANQRVRVVRITPDVTKPVIVLSGNSLVNLEVYNKWIEPGYSATDYYNRNLTSQVVVTGTVDTAHLGNYVLTYQVTDAAGNTQIITRTVKVIDTQVPVIMLNGSDSTTHCMGTAFTDPGATVLDNYNQGLQAGVNGIVNVNVAGTYKLTYNVSDSSGNAATAVSRTVIVIDCHIGIGETARENNLLNVYPNPASGIFQINLPGLKQPEMISVYNTLGDKVAISVSTLTPGRFLVEMDKPAAGVYYIRISHGNTMINSKVTILK